MENTGRPSQWDQVRRIGFLRRGMAFDTGDIEEAFFERLCELTQNPMQPWAMGGVHFCDLCRFVGNGVGTYYPKDSQGRIKTPGYRVSAASSSVNLWIPGDGFLFCCPTSITHYIDAHDFRPPADFCEAVLRCPPMRSVDYLNAILANGGQELGFDKLTLDD